MPIYTYICKNCSMKEELIQSMEEGDEYLNSPCKCGGERVRLIQATSFRLEGGGWYDDGY